MLRRSFFALAAAGLACAHPPELESRWSSSAITVDGAYAEWSGKLVRIDDSRSVALGVANDRTNLYLCLVTRDLDVQTLIERLGFTLWVDPAGGTERRIGFRVAPFTAGAKATAPAYVEIVQHGDEYGEQLVGSATGPIDVEAAARADVVAYEIRIALGTALSGSSGQAGVVLSPGARLGIGFETDALTSRRQTRVPIPPQQEPPPDPQRPPPPGGIPGDPRYEEEPPAPLELPRARKIPPLRAWVVTVLAKPGPGPN